MRNSAATAWSPDFRREWDNPASREPTLKGLPLGKRGKARVG